MNKGLIRAACALVVWSLSAPLALAQDGLVAPPPPETPAQPAETTAPPVEAPPPPASNELAAPAATHETVCDDHRDDDGDGLPDCADADCFENDHCQAGGTDERTNERCSDWVDNDGDGSVDCEDADCSFAGVTVCQGSWQRQGNPATQGTHDDVPALQGNQSVEDLIGVGSDADGERNDYVCSDGLDNDQDGRTDCADFGCRFDPSVSVCNGTPGVRLSLVAGVGASLIINETPDIDGDGYTEFSDPQGDVRFTRLQLRALGTIPFIQNSFFLINIRAERTFRLTFAMFQVPLGNDGHYFQINSGSGGLSPGLIVSTSKQPLLDPPYYLYNSFEQGSGAAMEVGGPLTDDDVLRYRIFAAGGSGEYSGNVGGRFFRSSDRNFSYAGGAQLQINAVGHYSRFDDPFIYTPRPLTIAFFAGARFDQRPVERYVAWNAFAILRYSHLILRAEHYGRYVLDFDGVQTSWNVQASVLIIPNLLMLAADVGGLFMPLAYDPSALTAVGYSAQFPQPVETFQVRGAVHWLVFRNLARISLLYSLQMNCQHVFGSQCLPPDSQPEASLTTHEVRIEAQVRF